MQSSLGPNTELAYERAFSEWESYAVDEAMPILPITPIDQGNFLADMADRTGSMSKINLTIAAVADRHLAEHMKSPTLDPSFRKMVAGIRRQLVRPSKVRAPLDLEILEEAFKLIEGGGRLQDWRTRCRLNLEFYGMLRWAEVSELRTEDLIFDTTGLVLHIRRSKTDQLGVGSYVRMNMTDLEHCPVEITRLYLQKLNYGTENGYLQPQVRSYKDGRQSGVWYKKLGYSTALEDTKASMAILGRNPAEYGEHSGRKGGTTAASEAGVSWIDLKRHGRWRSDSAPQRYIEETEKRSHNVAAALARQAETQDEEETQRKQRRIAEATEDKERRRRLPQEPLPFESWMTAAGGEKNEMPYKPRETERMRLARLDKERQGESSRRDESRQENSQQHLRPWNASASGHLHERRIDQHAVRRIDQHAATQISKPPPFHKMVPLRAGNASTMDGTQRRGRRLGVRGNNAVRSLMSAFTSAANVWEDSRRRDDKVGMKRMKTERDQQSSCKRIKTEKDPQLSPDTLDRLFEEAVFGEK